MLLLLLCFLLLNRYEILFIVKKPLSATEDSKFDNGGCNLKGRPDRQQIIIMNAIVISV